VNIWEIVLLWSNAHRVFMVLMVALILWVLAYGIYFRRIGVSFMARSRPHSWQVDLVTKSAMRGNRADVNGGNKVV